MTKKVLLVEDEAILAMAEAKMIQKHGFEVVTAHKGEKAVTMVEKDPDISLVLMDIDLGTGIDGPEAAQEILKIRDLPIVFLTSHSEKDYVDRVKKITNYGYVLKNSGEFVLLESINMAYTLFEAHRRQKEQEERYALAVYGGELGTWDWDVPTDVVVCNDKWALMKGYDSGEIEPHLNSWKILVRPEDLPHVMEKLTAHLRGETESYEAEYRMKSKSGDWLWIIDRGKVIERDNEGNPLRVCGTHLDVTEKKQAEEKLKKTKNDLDTRVHELECLHEIGHLVEEPGSTIRSIVEGSVRQISKHFMSEISVYPEIVLDEAEYDTAPDSKELETLVEKPIFVYGELAGSLKIKTTGQDKDHVHSCIEDRELLLELVTEQLGRIVERLKTETRYQILVDSLDEAILQADEEGIITYANDAAVKLCGYASREELVGLPMAVLYVDPSQRKTYIEELLTEGAKRNLEFELKRRNGSTIPTLCNFRLLKDENGIVRGTLGALRDMSQIQALIHRLRENKEFYEITLRSIGDGVVVTNAKGEVTLLNPVAEELTGCSACEAQGTALADIFHIVDSRTREKLPNPIEKVLSKGEMVTLSNHTKLISRKGTEFQIADSAAPIHSSKGKVEGSVLVFRDETEKYQKEQKLRESEEQFRNLFENMVQGVVYHASDGRIIRTNSAAERILGLSHGQLTGKTSLDPRWKAIHEDGSDYPGETHPAMIALRTGKRLERQIMGVFHPEKSEYVWISVSAFPEFRPGESEPYRVFTTFEDITQMKQAEKSLEIILNSIPEDIYLADMETYEVLFMNDQMKESFPQAKVGDTCYEIFRRNASPCDHCSNNKLFDEDGNIKQEALIWEGSNPVNGNWYINYDKAIQWFNGKIVRLQIAADITERKEMEQELLDTVREKDFLMKELNHRVKNNLNMITALIGMKSREFGEEVDLTSITSQIDAIRIVHEKLYTKEEVSRVDFKDYVQDLLTSIFSSFSGRYVEIVNGIEEVEIHTRTIIPLGLIVNEVATNAIKHGFSGGEEAQFTVKLYTDEEAQEYVLTLSNTGSPFPENIDIERPASIGLQLISTLVDQIDGTIKLQKKPYPVFTIRFPIEE